MCEITEKRRELKEGEMLLFIGDIGLHISQESDAPDVLSVRARVLADLIAVFPDATVVTDDEKDDRFRYLAKISRESVVQATFEWLMKIYTNKDKIRTEDFKQKELIRIRELVDHGMRRKEVTS